MLQALIARMRRAPVRYSVIFILLFFISGCVSMHPVSYDAGIAQVTPKSRALEILHELAPPEYVATSHPWVNRCLFSSDNVKSMDSGDVLQYQNLAFSVTRQWDWPGDDIWRVVIVRTDRRKTFCKFIFFSTAKGDGQSRAMALKAASRIATAWVAMGGKIAKN